MPDTGLAGMQTRVAQIQSVFARRPSTVAPGNGAFAQSLAAATAAPAAGADGAQAVSVASSYLGVPYRWGGTDPSTGLDCSGLAGLVYKRVGVTLPRTAAEQARAGTAVDSLADARPGDLVFFGTPAHHVGIYAGGGKMIDAPHTGSAVREERVWATPSAIRRVLPQAGTTAAAGAGSLAPATGTTATAGLSTPYADLFEAAGARHGVDPALLAAVARQESGFDPAAVSPAGARGLMQLMPGTARSLGVDPGDPAQAVDGAARLLAGNLRSFSGRVDLALAAYNAGAGNVRKYGGIPPFAETRAYVQKVQAYWGELR